MALDEQLRQLANQVPPPPAADATTAYRRGTRRRRVRYVASAAAVVSVVVVLGVGVTSLLDTEPRVPGVADQPDSSEPESEATGGNDESSSEEVSDPENSLDPSADDGESDPAQDEGADEGADDEVLSHDGYVGESDVPLTEEQGIAQDEADRRFEEARDQPKPVENAQDRPDLMVLDADEVPPDTVVELTFPEATMRAVWYFFEYDDGDVRDIRYILVPQNLRRDEPASMMEALDVRDPDNRDRGFPDVGREDEGPERVRVPADAEPGLWRICMPDEPTACAPITVTDG